MRELEQWVGARGVEQGINLSRTCVRWSSKRWCRILSYCWLSMRFVRFGALAGPVLVAPHLSAACKLPSS